MLSENLKPVGFNTWEKETWDTYRTRLRLPTDEAVLQFYRQVVYDHFEHFNDHYPDFGLENYEIVLETMTAAQADAAIRFFRGEIMDWWGEQYDYFAEQNQDYVIFQSMSQTGTFPFPPILMDAKLNPGTGRLECGRPLHLIEGTHRVSYLRHMLLKKLVAENSEHTFVVLRPV